MKRREFLKTATAGAMVPTLQPASRLTQASAGAQPAQGDRAVWVGHMRRLADPVLKNLAAGR